MIKSTSKILFIINLFVVGSVNASLTNVDDLKFIFTETYKKSWRNDKIVGTEQTISECLIDSFENNHKDKEKLQKIIDQIPLNFSIAGKNYSFWKKKYDHKRTMETVFLGNCNDDTDSNLHNNLRNQQDILDCRDLLIVKSMFEKNPTLLSHENFNNDDVVKGLSLSGTFCRKSEVRDSNNKVILDGDGKITYEFEPLFSGMLIPGQLQNETIYRIHSCLHGFIGEQIYKIYFIPYGIDLCNEDDNPNYEAAFQVKDLRKNVNKKTCASQYELNSIANEKSGYAQQDYAMVRIKSNSEYEVNNVSYQKNLVTVLKERNKRTNNLFDVENLFPGFMEQNGNLPELSGNNSLYNDQFKNFSLNNNNSLQQYFVIGRPGEPNYKLNDSEFAVVTNVTQFTFPAPIRSLRNDLDEPNPPSVGHKNQLALDIPTYYGMSGGIVLKTITHINNGKIERVARPIGTIWGSERRINDKKIVGLNAFINLIDNN